MLNLDHPDASSICSKRVRKSLDDNKFLLLYFCFLREKNIIHVYFPQNTIILFILIKLYINLLKKTPPQLMHSSAVNHATFLNLFHIMGRLVPAHNNVSRGSWNWGYHRSGSVWTNILLCWYLFHWFIKTWLNVQRQFNLVSKYLIFIFVFITLSSQYWYFLT